MQPCTMPLDVRKTNNLTTLPAAYYSISLIRKFLLPAAPIWGLASIAVHFYKNKKYFMLMASQLYSMFISVIQGPEIK